MKCHLSTTGISLSQFFFGCPFNIALRRQRKCRLVAYAHPLLVVLVAVRAVAVTVVRSVAVAASASLITGHALERALRVYAELVLRARLAQNALVNVHAAVLRVHLVAHGALEARLRAGPGAVVRTRLVTRRADGGGALFE